MSDSPASGVMATEGMSDTTDAFQAAMDSETPSRSKRATRDNDEAPAKMAIDDLFSQKEIDRSEQEGGADEPPPKVRDDEDVDEDESSDAEEAEVEEEVEEEPQRAGDLDLEQVIRTTIDGEEVELPLSEAIRSGMREKTFHKYLSQLDLAVRETNQQRQNLTEHYQQHLQAVREFDTWMNELVPQPDWPTLFRADPTRAMTLKVEWDEMQQKREGVRGYLSAMQQRQRQEEVRQLHNFANANRAQLASTHPEWKDEKVWRRDHDSMRRTAQSAGYSDDEVNTLYDARAVTILNWASKYLRMMAAKPKPVKQGFTPGKRNGATPRNVSRAFDRAERRVSRGDARGDLEATFERMLNTEG
jgi:hypothetical protein